MGWELCRKSYPLGIRFQGDDFETKERQDVLGQWD
jgi:hypothetical protein